MKVTLERGDFGTYLLVADDGRDLLFQTDWDYPVLASLFGYIPRYYGRSNGTVAWEKEVATAIISGAIDYLDDHIGDACEDPGYFEN